MKNKRVKSDEQNLEEKVKKNEKKISFKNTSKDDKSKEESQLVEESIKIKPTSNESKSNEEESKSSNNESISNKEEDKSNEEEKKSNEEEKKSNKEEKKSPFLFKLNTKNSIFNNLPKQKEESNFLKKELNKKENSEEKICLKNEFENLIYNFKEESICYILKENKFISLGKGILLVSDEGKRITFVRDKIKTLAFDYVNNKQGVINDCVVRLFVPNNVKPFYECFAVKFSEESKAKEFFKFISK